MGLLPMPFSLRLSALPFLDARPHRNERRHIP